MQDFELIAKTFQGLETTLALELTELGANNIQIGRRMVSFTGNKEMMYRANFQLRTAIRILKPIKHFRATTAEEVYKAVKAIDWTQYLTLDTTFAIDSVVFSDEFRHSKFVAYKVKDAIVDQFREKTGDRPNIRIINPDIKLHIHVAEYDCTLSLDSSGDSLHRRGYRQEAVEAPLNEVLAAGIILQTGWRGECDFIDPMCGSGTFAIEAALIARGIAPGVFRSEFAFEKWADFDAQLFEAIYEDDSRECDFNHHIYAYDINRKAVEIATRNIRAAGLSKDITIAQQDFKDFLKPMAKSIMVMNPPYGERISSPDLLGLYRMIGERLKHQFQGNDAWILSYREECFDQIGLRPSLRTPLFNGSLECELRKYQTFDGKFDQMRASGGDIKTAKERRMMADTKRFKQNRSFRKGFNEADDDDSREQQQFRPRRNFNRDDKRSFHERRDFRRENNERDERFRSRREFAREDDNSDNRFGEPRRFDRERASRDGQQDAFRPRREFNTDKKPSFNRPPYGGFKKDDRGFRRGDRPTRFDKSRGFRNGGRSQDNGFAPFRRKNDRPNNFNRFEDYEED